MISEPSTTLTAPAGSAGVRRHPMTVASQWPLGLLVAALGWLIFFLPYAAGYGDFRMTIAQWLKIHWAEPTWQHGMLTVPIAAFLVWRRRGILAATPAQPSWLGLILAACALGLYWIGYRGNFYFIGYTSLQLFAAAMVLFLWGWSHFRLVSFAWFILAFAWPYLFLEDSLAFQLRYLMVHLTAGVLNVAGITTLQDGTSLISAAHADRALGAWFHLNVDGPCSGMRSLFALMLVSALYGYFRQRTFWRRLLLFALSIPLAVIANMVRILVLIGASIAFGQDFAVGRGEEYTSNFHFLAGIAVFLVAILGLKFAEYLLNRFCGKEKALSLIEAK